MEIIIGEHIKFGKSIFDIHNVLVAQPNVIEIKYIKKHFFMYLSV